MVNKKNTRTKGITFIKKITENVGNNTCRKVVSKDRDNRWKKTGKKKVISYFNYAAKQYTISVLETRSKHTLPLTKQRDFIRWILVKYFSNIRKAPFWPSFKDMELWLYIFFVFLVFVLEKVLS